MTGGTGFVGYHVVRVLRDAQHDVCVLVRNTNDRDRLEELGASVVFGNLATGQGIDKAMANADAVFHVAAHYSLDRRDAAIMHRVNVEGTRRLVEAVRKIGGPRLVYTSSTAAIGLREDGQAADESHFVDPAHVHSVYKQTKVLAERIILEAARTGMDIVVVNPSTPVGPFDVKPTPTGRIILDTMNGRMPGYVETGLNLIAVEDVAVGHLLAYKHGISGERYILGHRNMKFSEMIETIARLADKPVPKLKIPLWAAMAAGIVDDLLLSSITKKSPRVPLAGVRLAKTPMYFSAGKAVRELGLPQNSVEEALLRAVQWFNNPTRLGRGVANDKATN